MLEMCPLIVRLQLNIKSRCFTVFEWNSSIAKSDGSRQIMVMLSHFDVTSMNSVMLSLSLRVMAVVQALTLPIHDSIR